MDQPFDLERMRVNAGAAARLLKALANENRLLVLCQLLAGERSVGELNAELALSQSALSQHLALLREDGLVATRREAQTIYYRLASDAVAGVLTALHRIYCGPVQSQESWAPPDSVKVRPAAGSRLR
ncbi:MAG: helix-turn-helix transcriptional regulator [Xanthomonadales bacterium]|nr:Transcriptional activator HlyU [Xanthomonadales bacterium]MCC6593210.1 helix-turn-helix transcriptional regulator [Xanthomonadales bacterium]MCE7932672.1 transcriptional regulator [Xanthomonadales bacterium PRO6]